MQTYIIFNDWNRMCMLWFTLRSCVMSGLSSLGERSMVRDSLLPDSPRVKIDAVRKTVISVGTLLKHWLKTWSACVVLFVYLWVWRCYGRRCGTGSCWASGPGQVEGTSSGRMGHLTQTFRSVLHVYYVRHSHITHSLPQYQLPTGNWGSVWIRYHQFVFNL